MHLQLVQLRRIEGYPLPHYHVFTQSYFKDAACRRQQNQIQQELSAILKRQQQLERTNERLQEKASDIRRSLQDLDLSDGRYHQLKTHNETELTLKDIVAVSYHN